MGETDCPRARPRAVLVRACGLSVALAGQRVLDHVDLEVSAGEIVTLIGPNGAGKTTLVRALLGLVGASGGMIERPAGTVVGYVPQRVAIDPVMPMTVRRFLRLAGRFDEARLAAGLAEVSAGHLIDRAVQTLSGGELQRVLLARALLREPMLLILDEPVQGVDFAGQFDLFDLIVRIRETRGCGVLLVSHDLHLVMAATDRVVCLNGHVCCAGRPEEVSRDPALAALFGPRAARELAVYHHAHDHRHDLHGEVRPLTETAR